MPEMDGNFSPTQVRNKSLLFLYVMDCARFLVREEGLTLKLGAFAMVSKGRSSVRSWLLFICYFWVFWPSSGGR